MLTIQVVSPRAGLFDFGSKKQGATKQRVEKPRGRGKGLAGKIGNRTLGDIAAENTKAGWRSSSKGAAGFASKKLSYIEVQCDDEGYVDPDADVMGKVMKFFGGKK